MSGTKKKKNGIEKSTRSVSTKPSKSLKMKRELKDRTLGIAAKKKKDGKSSVKPKQKKSSLSSMWRLSGGELDSSVQDALNSVKKRSTLDQEKGGDGWVRATKMENTGFNKLAEYMRHSRGRPRRDPESIAKVEGLRLSKAELETIIEKANEEGFSSWRVWARKKLLESI